MKQARMNRLFAPSGHCFDVAIDHGMFNETSFLGGIENMTKSIHTVAKAAPDCKPNKEMATATASSKKLEVPIRHAGPATLCGSFNQRAPHQEMKKIP